MKIEGKDIYLRFLEETDAEAMLALNLRNKDFFQLTSPLRPADFLTLEAQRDIINKDLLLKESDERYHFGIFLRDQNKLIGSISLFNVARGPVQGCMVGYSLDQQHNGRGYMSQAVELTVRYAFETLRFHRIIAGVMPRNISSARVLEKAGFHREGIARQEVKINGKWEDHQMFAIISDCFDDQWIPF